MVSDLNWAPDFFVPKKFVPEKFGPRKFGTWEIWALRNLVPEKFRGAKISLGPTLLGTKNFRGPKEIGDHFSHNLINKIFFTLFMYVKNGPNKTSLATASKTRLPPIILFKLALKVANSTPIATIGDQILIVLI